MLRSAEIAHKPHINYPRFGAGAITSYWQAQAVARFKFLDTTDELYPEMRADLEHLAAALPELPTGRFWDLDGRAEDGSELPPTQNPVGRFCKRWGLTLRGEPAEWACYVIWDTIGHFQRHGGWCWAISWSIGTLAADECRVGDGRLFLVDMTRLKDMKNQVPRSVWPALTAIMGRAKALGLPKGRREPSEHVFRWAVRHMVEPETSWRDLLAPGSAGSSEEVIKAKATEILRLIGLGRPSGRPRKSARS
ncbi:MAG: hypothetical protein Q8O57_11850 [Kiritimatiellota bacterium]|nr:hypothetical protein [Kiritimatiellota bacterium]